MSISTTVIAALKCEGVVIIGSDTQATDYNAQVRWPCEKLDRIRDYPLLIGFSGSMGMADRARKAIEATTIHINTFGKRDLIRDAVERCLNPVYRAVDTKKLSPTTKIWDITLWGLAAYWAENSPHILEFEANGDCSFHNYFHAIGSGSSTAYAIWRTLGGVRLSALNRQKGLYAILRILRTCVNIEMMGVSEPFIVWVVSNQGARKLLDDEIQAEMQYVDAWEERDRKAFFDA